MTHKLLTANRLRDGEVVYLTADASWSESLQDAVVSDQPGDQDQLLASGAEAEARCQVIGAYLMAVGRGDGQGWHPMSQRELIRMRGPSVRDDLGKQAADLAAQIGEGGHGHVSL